MHVCRSSKGGSAKQLKQAASLLKAAAGVQYAEPGQQSPENSLIPKQAMVEIHPDLYVAANTFPPALNKLAEIYIAGESKIFLHCAANEIMQRVASNIWMLIPLQLDISLLVLRGRDINIDMTTLKQSRCAGDQGLPFNPGAAFALSRHSANLGDAEAQRSVGLHQAAGVYAPAANATHKRELTLTFVGCLLQCRRMSVHQQE